MTTTQPRPVRELAGAVQFSKTISEFGVHLSPGSPATSLRCTSTPSTRRPNQSGSGSLTAFDHGVDVDRRGALDARRGHRRALLQATTAFGSPGRFASATRSLSPTRRWPRTGTRVRARVEAAINTTTWSRSRNISSAARARHLPHERPSTHGLYRPGRGAGRGQSPAAGTAGPTYATHH